MLTENLATLQRDINSLGDHAGYVSAEITFLLDAFLGQINIEKNQIFKVLAVFSAALLRILVRRRGVQRHPGLGDSAAPERGFNLLCSRRRGRGLR